MKDLNIKFAGFIYQYLPPAKRTSTRILWLTALISLQGLFDDFSFWRSDFRRMTQITSQKLVLQNHLQGLFGKGVMIQNYVSTFVLIGLNEEKSYWKSFGNDNENLFIDIPLNGESISDFDDCDFLVLAPENVNKIKLTDEIDRYKLADKSYKILITKD